MQTFPVVPAAPPTPCHAQTLGKQASGSVPGHWKPSPHQSAQSPPVCPGILAGGAVSTPGTLQTLGALISAQGSTCAATEPSLTTRGRLTPSNDQGSPVAPGQGRVLPGGVPPSALLQPPWGAVGSTPKFSSALQAGLPVPGQLCPLGSHPHQRADPSTPLDYPQPQPGQPSSRSTGPSPPPPPPASTHLGPPWALRSGHSSPRPCHGHSCEWWHTWG